MSYSEQVHIQVLKHVLQILKNMIKGHNGLLFDNYMFLIKSVDFLFISAYREGYKKRCQVLKSRGLMTPAGRYSLDKCYYFDIITTFSQ